MTSLIRVAFFFIALLPRCIGAKQYIAAITKPVTDLRVNKTIHACKPHHIHGFVSEEDQDTQLLYGEHVNVIYEDVSWLLVEAPDQKKYVKNTLGTMSGWIERKHARKVNNAQTSTCTAMSLAVPIYEKPDRKSKKLLIVSFGTRLAAKTFDEVWSSITCVDGTTGYAKQNDLMPLENAAASAHSNIGNRIVELARMFIGQPYSWGGRSSFNSHSKTFTGVDCSSLVHLCYRVIGIDIPRNCNSQLQYCTKIQPQELQKGDLIFLGKAENPGNIAHVMLYSGNGKYIDAYGPDSKDFKAMGLSIRSVEEVSAHILLGKPLDAFSKNGEFSKAITFDGITRRYAVYFARVPYEKH